MLICIVSEGDFLKYMAFSVIRAIFTARLALLKCRLSHAAGTDWPGDVAMARCPDILSHLAENVNCLLVTGTNGKTTTAAMIRKIFHSRGIPVVSNKEGANLESGLVVSFLWHCTPWGSSFRRYAVLECDEKWVPTVFRKVKPKVLVVTNLSEDQLDRTGGPEALYRLILSGITDDDTVLCINESCPISGRLAEEGLKNRIISFSASGATASVNGRTYPVRLSVPGNYNIENAAAAAAACLAFDIPCEESLAALEDFKAPFGRMENFSLDGVPVTICLAKNVVSADNVLSHIETTEPEAQVVFGIHANWGDGADRSWISGISVPPGMKCLSGVIISGDCTGEIAAHLKDSGYPVRKAKTTEEVFSLIRESSRPVYLVTSYTYMMEIRNLFVKQGDLKDFWKT